MLTTLPQYFQSSNKLWIYSDSGKNAGLNLIPPILLLLFALAGIIFHPFFYTFLLVFFVSRRKELINVLRAIMKPIKTISLTVLLMFMVIYAFTVWSYSYYSSDYTQNDCHTLWTCFVVSFDNTFKNDGGLGGYLGSAYTQETDDVNVNYGRVVYDNLAFLLVGILLIEIISGIIIDTFAELRQKNNEIDADQNKFCFICNRSRENLEKELGAEGFKYHIYNQHFMWDYLFFIAYLGSKKEKEGQVPNTTERYVQDKIEKDDHSWLPCYSDKYS